MKGGLQALQAKRRERPQRRLGRAKGKRRLADPASKMADKTMAELNGNFQNESLLFNDAYIHGKLPCPHRSCRSETGIAFFLDLTQHYRIKHREVVFNEQMHNREALRLLNFCHGNEMMQHLNKVFAECSLKVSTRVCLNNVDLIIIFCVGDTWFVKHIDVIKYS